MIRKHRRRWGNLYGDTHTGSVWTLLGVPVWRWRKPITPPQSGRIAAALRRFWAWYSPPCPDCQKAHGVCADCFLDRQW